MNSSKAPIVVGVDDTDAGRAALSFAMREATGISTPCQPENAIKQSQTLDT